jgi:glucokinase
MNAIAIDLGGTNLRAAVVASTGDLVEKTASPLGDRGDGEGIVASVVEIAKELLDRFEAGTVGIGAAGPLDFRRGVMFSPPNIPGLAGMHLASRIHEALGLPVFLENDANASVYGEYRAGAGRDAGVLLGLTLGTGVGGGIVLGGVPVRGPDGTAAELGHIVVDPLGLPCPCGGRGHLEALASATATASRFRDGVRTGRASLPKGCPIPLDEVESSDVDRFARAGHEWAREVLAETGRWLGLGIASLVACFNPDVVLILGGLAGAFDLFEPALKAAFRKQAIAPSAGRVSIVKGALGDDAGLVGAALLALERQEADKPY